MPWQVLVQPIFIHDLLHGLSHLRVLLAGYTHGIPLDERDIPVSVEILYLEQQFPDMGTVYAGLDDGNVIDLIEHQLSEWADMMASTLSMNGSPWAFSSVMR